MTKEFIKYLLKIHFKKEEVSFIFIKLNNFNLQVCDLPNLSSDDYFLKVVKEDLTIIENCNRTYKAYFSLENAVDYIYKWYEDIVEE
jgi:hypothetical protein